MRILILSTMLALAACTTTPAVVIPPAPIPATYPTASETAGTTRTADIGWRAMFGDPRLQGLIELALSNNRDLRLAMLNVQAVQAQYRIQRADGLPSVDLTGNTSRSRVAPADRETSRAIQRSTSVGLGTSAFELDLWGRAQAMSDAAFARYLASDFGSGAARISLIAAVADAYFAERLAGEQFDLAERTLANWTEQRRLAEQRKLALQDSALELAQAESQVARAQADLEARTRERARAGNALSQLVGVALQGRDLPAPMPLDQQPVITRLPAGLPSELLLYRPDILQAEEVLRAANADVGAARAAFFPRVSLTASVGVASPTMGGLFDGGNHVWSFVPQIVVPIFDGGRLRAELRLSEVRKSSAVAEYERVIQTAFREVADGLAGVSTYEREIDAQTRVVAQEARRVALSDQRYRAGVEGRLELLDAERQAYAARQQLLELRREQIGSAVALYKALGGGLVDGDVIGHRAPQVEG